jgi:hypothetical protein
LLSFQDSVSLLSKSFLQLGYLNPFDDPLDVVSVDDQIAGAVDIGIGCLSIFLAIMAYNAYRKTNFPQLKYVVIAFSLFTAFLAVEAFQEFLPFNDDSFDLLLSIIILLILISFSFGILKIRNKKLKDEN